MEGSRHFSLLGQLHFAKQREKDTDHPYHCYHREVVVKERPTHLHVQGNISFNRVPLSAMHSF